MKRDYGCTWIAEAKCENKYSSYVDRRKEFGKVWFHRVNFCVTAYFYSYKRL